MTPKFRAWDNEMEMMVYQGDDEIYICFDGEKCKLLDYYGTHWETDEYGMDEIEQPWEVENIEIMQWTGLKDSNGVEIYEGDILIETKSKDTFEVKYGWFEDVSVSTFLQMGVYLYDGYETRPFYRLNYKVIGNIYENPELLED